MSTWDMLLLDFWKRFLQVTSSYTAHSCFPYTVCFAELCTKHYSKSPIYLFFPLSNFFFFYSMCVGATCYVRGQRIMLGQHKSVTVAYVKGQGIISSSAYWLPDQPTGMIAAGQERRWSGLRNHFLVSVLVVSGIVRRSCGSWWSESFWFTCKSWRQVAGEKIHFIKSKDTVCFSRCTTVDATDQWIISRFHFFLFFFFFFWLLLGESARLHHSTLLVQGSVYSVSVS